jgi:hypothetical protein
MGKTLFGNNTAIVLGNNLTKTAVQPVFAESSHPKFGQDAKTVKLRGRFNDTGNAQVSKDGILDLIKAKKQILLA